MKALLLPATLATAVLCAVPAMAQSPVSANQRYCLEVRDATGIHPLLCRFESLAQCRASVTSVADVCMLNPALAFQQRGR